MCKVFMLVLLWAAGMLSNAMGQSGASLTRLSMPDSKVIEETSSVPATYQQLARRRALQATQRINVFIISREKKINLASTLFRVDAFFRRIFNKKIVLIKAGSLKEMASKTDAYMQEHPAQMIGHLWIDSHGRYKKGYALFSVGVDTINAYNLKFSQYLSCLERLTAYCDEETKVTIGACYSAADFQRPGNDRLTPSYMAGDSLLLRMSEVFRISPVYGSLSWIMVKPFVFGSRWGISGYPLERKYMDEIYRPVWERLGQWKMVPAGQKVIEDIPTPYLTSSGSLETDGQSYLSRTRNQRRMEKKLRKLKPGMYHLDKK